MAKDYVTMEKLTTLAKQRGFVYPGSALYGGLANAWDFGPLGAQMRMNLKAHWWKHVVESRADMVGLDGAILMNPRVWEASGHVETFNDPLVEDKVTHKRYRADHLIEEVTGENVDGKSLEELGEIIKEKGIKSPEGNDLTAPRQFSGMFEMAEGSVGADRKIYLRPETAQAIFVNFKNVLTSSRKRLPFGIAQIGKAFRNEITARQFIFRTREFEQMEMQFFVHPDEAMQHYELWKERRMQFYVDIGINPENLQWHKHENLVFYATEAYDIEYKYPFGWKELEGIHARGDYDLTQHSKHSGQKLEYNDQEKGEKYIPHVVETSAGVARTALAVLSDAYTEEKVGDEMRVVLKLHPKLAPFKLAVLPLSKKEELVNPARQVFQKLAGKYHTDFDITQSIGKRYRRQDEIGTPYCVTVDFDSLEDKAVTVRDRDSMKQVRVPIEELEQYFADKFGF